MVKVHNVRPEATHPILRQLAKLTTERRGNHMPNTIGISRDTVLIDKLRISDNHSCITRYCLAIRA